MLLILHIYQAKDFPIFRFGNKVRLSMIKEIFGNIVKRIQSLSTLSLAVIKWMTPQTTNSKSLTTVDDNLALLSKFASLVFSSKIYFDISTLLNGLKRLITYIQSVTDPEVSENNWKSVKIKDVNLEEIRYLFDWRFFTPCQNKEGYSISPAFFEDPMTRLASFRHVKQENVFFSKLAEAGFYYSNTEVICHGCGNRKPISSIDSAPDGSDYHLDGCSFSRTDAVSTLVTEPTHVGPVDDDSSADHGDCGGAFARPDVRVYTVPMGHPANPAYITLQKRLESFRQWPADHVHSPASLARSGFYYAGYSDCVRCFYCGLGLKSWKPGDDIVDQHQKFRPSCHFLLRQTGQQQSHANTSNIEPQHTTPGNSDTSDQSQHTSPGNSDTSDQPQQTTPVIQKEYTNNAKVTLLKKENDVLRSQLKCKVCRTAPIKDLFLPCGDLYACGDCSKSLTHCPACNKQILATVTTFFT